MPKRRGRGEGGLHWDPARERWTATASLGFDPAGRRIVKKARGITKTDAKAKLRDLLRDLDDGLATPPELYTVGEAVEDWLSYGLNSRDPATVETCTHLCNIHIVPALGRRRLRELSAEEVDRWLAEKSRTLSTRTLQGLYSCLNRSVKRAITRDKVKRNVVALCTVPTGQPGRPSKSLSLAQALAVLEASQGSRMHAYIVVSLLTGARTEEMRALQWDHVHLAGRPKAHPPVPPHVEVWRSVRKGGDTKTRKSRRTLALAQRCVVALAEQLALQDRERVAAGDRWREHGLVFATTLGTPLDSSHVRRDFRVAIRGAEGVDPREWTPRELRHSFVSLLSDQGMPLEDISRLVGHSSTAVTELVYRKQIRPVLQLGAVTMDRVFGDPNLDR